MSEIPTLQDFYRWPAFAKEGLKYGVESEVEGTELLPTINTEGWTSKPDNSLRFYGTEYVSRNPFCDKTIKKELDFLFKRLAKCPVIKDSPRTSTHLHYNMRDRTHRQVCVAAGVYWLLENILFKMCGEDREGNLFCLRLNDASGVLPTLNLEMNRAGTTFFPFQTLNRLDSVRYSGLNLISLPKFGTLEFRGMRGVYETEPVLGWVNLLDTMVINAILHYADPCEAIVDYNTIGASAFVTKVLGEHAAIVDKVCPSTQWGSLIDRNLHNVASFALSTDWSTLDSRNVTTLELLMKKKSLLKIPKYTVELDQAFETLARPVPRAR